MSKNQKHIQKVREIATIQEEVGLFDDLEFDSGPDPLAIYKVRKYPVYWRMMVELPEFTHCAPGMKVSFGKKLGEYDDGIIAKNGKIIIPNRNNKECATLSAFAYEVSPTYTNTHKDGRVEPARPDGWNRTYVHYHDGSAHRAEDLWFKHWQDFNLTIEQLENLQGLYNMLGERGYHEMLTDLMQDLKAWNTKQKKQGAKK